MENGINQFLFFNEQSSNSESTTGLRIEESVEKKISFVFERRMFENINPESKNKLTAKESERNFKHLEFNELSEESKYRPKIKKHTKNKSYRRSMSLPSGSQIFSAENSTKDFNIKNLTSSDISKKNLGFPFSEREIIQPITSRDLVGDSRYKRAPLKTLDELVSLEKTKVSQFNTKIRKKLKEYLETHDNNLLPIPLSTVLNQRAQDCFDMEVKKETKEKLQLKRTSSFNLVKSCRSRAQPALIHVQKSMILLDEIIPRLKFLQNSFFKILTLKKEKKTTSICYKTIWIDDFFKGLDNLISSYAYRKQEMNPLKSFTHIFAEQVNDPKMHELIFLGLKIGSKEFDNVMFCLNWWADSKNILELTERVSYIDHIKIREKLDLSIENIANQKHEWFESLNSNCPISQITNSEVIRCLIPDNVVLYDEITVNDKIIQLNNCNGTSETRQIKFFTILLHAIYSLGFDKNITEKESREQANVLVNLNKISKLIKEDLFKNTIPWQAIQKNLSDFPAIPFSALKNYFDPMIHEETLEELLIELAIPCVNVLKLCTNSCWLRGDECIRFLFTKIFKIYGDDTHPQFFHTSQENGISCHIHVKNRNHYFVTQTKCYGTHHFQDPLSKSGKPLNFAKTIFQWTVSPYKDNDTGFSGWRGLLEIPHVDVDENTQMEIKREFLKTLNNPNIVDYVVNSMDGKPKIISNFG